MMKAKQHTILQSAVLHLIPGFLGLIAYIFLAPAFLQLGYPALFSFLVVAAVVIMPLEFGYLLWQGKLVNGSILPGANGMFI